MNERDREIVGKMMKYCSDIKYLLTVVVLTGNWV